MATKFPPGQDMENISPKDLEEAKTYTKERNAYKEASNIGSNTNDYRKENVENINEKKRFENKQNDILNEKRKKAVYERESKLYEREIKHNPPGSLSYDLVKKMDSMGDVARSVGKKMGVNNMTSRNDEAQMEARKDVKGYAGGGKTKKMAPGGKVTDKVDYEKDLFDYARTGTDKINKKIEKVEDLKVLKHAPEAAAKLTAAMIGALPARAASSVVNAYRDLPSGKKMRENLGSSYKNGGSVSSASSRADGCATKGKTKGRMV